MANATLQLVIDSGSPTLSYTPFSDSLGLPDLRGWNPYNDLTGFASTLGQEGNGSSRHITAGDGATFSVPFFGVGIQLFGNISQAGTYDLTLDGQTNSSISSFFPSDPTILAFYTNLTATNHTLSLTFHNPTGSNGTLMSVERAVILVDESPEAIFTSRITDDTALPFVGQWIFTEDQTLGSSDSTFHVSSNAGDRFSFAFNGSTVALTGFHGPDSGNYSVQLDGNTTTFTAAASSFTEPTTLFFAAGLGPSAHNMTVINLSDRQLAIGAINVTTISAAGSTGAAGARSSHSHLSGGSIAAIVVASILGALVITLLGLLFWWRRRQQALRRKMFVADTVLDSDVMDISPYSDEQKPPSKDSPAQRDSANSRSFTLSLPIQSRPSQHSQREYSGNSVQELPRSPSVSVVGSQPVHTNGANSSQNQFLDMPRGSPFALEFAERAVRERARMVPAAPRAEDEPLDAPVATDSTVPPSPTTPISPMDFTGTPRTIPQSEETNSDSPIRAPHFSFLDISSRDGSHSSGEGRSLRSYDRTSTSSSERARRNRLSEQTTTAGSQTRPISLGYAFQYHRHSDLGLFREAQLQPQPDLPPEASVASGVSDSRPTPFATSPLASPPISPSAVPTSPIRPLPRLPQSVIITPPSAGPSRIAAEWGTSRTPALQLQTEFQLPPPPPPALLSPERERVQASAATSTGLTFAFGTNRDGTLLQAGTLGRRRFSEAGSPTESVPLSVSDIHFRHSSDEEREAAAQREMEPAIEDTPRPYASPFIMQRLRGKQAWLGPPGVRAGTSHSRSRSESSEPQAGPSSAPGLESTRPKS